MMFPFAPYLLAGRLSLAACLACFLPSVMDPIQTERFRLSAAPCAAEGYPMEVEDGEFLNSDGTSYSIAPEFLEGDWGLSAISWGVGNPLQPAPERFWVRWFSYPEDKFYEGHFLLPQRRIHDLLKQGYWNTDDKEQQTYYELTLCLLPKGLVVLWLSGAGQQVLIGRYEGHQINFDFKRFNERANRARMIQQEQAKLPPTVQHEIKTHTLSTKQWDNYLKTYNWQLGFSQPLKLYDYFIRYFNAEKTSYFPTPDATPYLSAMLESHPRPVPSNMLLRVDAGYGRKRQIQIRALDEVETLAAFQTLSLVNPTLPLTLYIDTDERVSKVHLVLKNERQQIELGKAKVELYDAY